MHWFELTAYIIVSLGFCSRAMTDAGNGHWFPWLLTSLCWPILALIKLGVWAAE